MDSCVWKQGQYFHSIEVPAWAHLLGAQGLSMPLLLASQKYIEHSFDVRDWEIVMSKRHFCCPATDILHSFSPFCHLVSVSIDQLNKSIGHIRTLYNAYDKSLLHFLFDIQFLFQIQVNFF